MSFAEYIKMNNDTNIVITECLINRRTLDDQHLAIGAKRKPDTKWGRSQAIALVTFQVGEQMTFATFRLRVLGVLLAAGHRFDYAKSMTTPKHLANGWYTMFDIV
jgi:hypothetical protein